MYRFQVEKARQIILDYIFVCFCLLYYVFITKIYVLFNWILLLANYLFIYLIMNGVFAQSNKINKLKGKQNIFCV